RPVLLVGAHLQQHPRPRLPGVVEDGEHHLDVVADERARVGDGAVDVRLGGEVEDVVDGADLAGEGGRDGGGQVVHDRGDPALVVGRDGCGDALGVAVVPQCPGQDDVGVGVREEVGEHVGADESGGACEEDAHGGDG